MTQNRRLLHNPNSAIDFSRPLTFTFNGKILSGYEGDTLASALLANGIDVVGRSFKYSRPRGIMAAGAEEPNAIMQLGATEETQVPNVRATQQALFSGLVCKTANGWPNVNNDVMGLIGKIGANLMPPGFYYKTFMHPASMWKTYEKAIRKAAGIGRSPIKNDPDIYDHKHQHTDILIVGAGPTGLAAAYSAAQSGARIIVADEQTEMGGSLLHTKALLADLPTREWVKNIVSKLSEMPNVTLLPRATVNGYHDHNFLTINECLTDHLYDQAPQGAVRQRMHFVRAKWVILATGAHERPLVYSGNDIPGNMLASAISTYINRYSVILGKSLVVMTANDSGYQAAFDWKEIGGEVLVVDTRQRPTGDVTKKAENYGIKVLTGSAVIEAKGSTRVTGVSIAPISEDGNRLLGESIEYLCDTVATSGGWSPAVHLSCHTGSRPIWDEDIIGFVPGTTIQNQLTAGAINGEYDLHRCLEAGFAVGQEAATNIGFNTSPTPLDIGDSPKSNIHPPMAIFHIPHIIPTSQAPKQFVDFQNDVTAAAIELATREGFESIEHVKRYTALGFGTDQGKTGNINGMAITAKSLNKSIPETGTTIFRPNYTPVSFGAIAGRHCDNLYDPIRYTAMHQWHVKNGALFEDVGLWKRPWYYPKSGETMQQALDRECLATRNGVGILDASTLGKIDIQGKDAREFLSRIYTNAWAKLAIGKCRYGLMCGEDGMVFDDGVTSCLAENHFIMTTTTGGAARVLNWLELYHQTEWPELEVYFNTITDHWATMTISGPYARELIQEVCTDVDFSREAFKFMDWKQGTVADVPARIFRISFTGELSFEINVQANYGMHVWEAIHEKGKKYNLTPYGTETMHILRAEKGFIITGQDTDGSVTPIDLGMSWCVSNKKPFSYVGKRGMQREDCIKQNRKQLVGLLTKNPTEVIPEGSQAVDDPNQPIPMTMLGHITSSYYSANLQRSIAMGFIRDGFNKKGETVYYPQPDGPPIEAVICDPIFLDPKGERQHV